MTMPALFVGHGNPMNAIEDNDYTGRGARSARRLPRPRAILCGLGALVRPGHGRHRNAAPRTIHDFGGFPRRAVRGAVPGAGRPGAGPARRAARCAPLPVTLDDDWGLDHGTWSVLMPPVPDGRRAGGAAEHRRPAAARRPPRDRPRARAAARRGRADRRQRQHRAQPARLRLGTMRPEPYDWAVRFDAEVASVLDRRRPRARSSTTPTLGRGRALSIPTPDHYLPLLYVIGARPAGGRNRVSRRRRRRRLDVDAGRQGRSRVAVTRPVAGRCSRAGP